MITGWVCAVCGARVDIARAYSWTCPSATVQDWRHVLLPVDDGRGDVDHVRSAGHEHANTLVAHRHRSAWWAFAMANGMDDDSAIELALQIGDGFDITPFAPHEQLSATLDVEVWVKDETANVAGSHKARHLVGILLHLLVAEQLGLVDERPPLAISSCGNAALAAATLAARVEWPIQVFVPTWMDAAFGDGLDRLGADVQRCPRDGTTIGDPAMAGFRRAVVAGAVPFSVQGPQNAWCLDTGRTIGWEMHQVMQSMDVDLERVYVQVGGGAFATCLSAGLGDTVSLRAVQAAGCAPLDAALRAIEGDQEPARRWSEVMTPWTEPHSLADGILDDETYDWLGIVQRVRATQGASVVASEEQIIDAHRLVAECGAAVSATGTAGLAGLLADLASGDQPVGPVAVVFSGVAR